MLILGRRVDESLVIPEVGLQIKVVGFESNSVRLGVIAPRDIRVHRGEVWVRVTGLPLPDGNNSY